MRPTDGHAVLTERRTFARIGQSPASPNDNRALVFLALESRSLAPQILQLAQGAFQQFARVGSIRHMLSIRNVIRLSPA